MSEMVLKNKKKKTAWTAIAFVVLMSLPAVSNVLVFWLGVNIQSLFMAFTDYDTGAFTWNNFTEAVRMFTVMKGSDLSLALTNTSKFFLLGLFTTLLTLLSSYCIFKKCFANSFIRVMLYLPGAISSLMMAKLFNQFGMADGVLGRIVEALGGDMHGMSLMTNDKTALGAIMFFDTWLGLGSGMVVWYGAMGRIPEDLMEYGKLEGIRELREFFTIVMPLLWPTFVTMITLTVIGFFGSSGSVLVFTQGQYNTMTIAYWMYHIVNTGQESLYNLANAAGIIMMVIMLPIVFLSRKFLNRYGKEVEY